MDIQKIPFSRRGSYLAISYCRENYRGYGNSEGLYLRTVSGAASTPFVLRFQLLHDRHPARFHTRFDGMTLQLISERGRIVFCFSDPQTILCTGTGQGLGLRMDEICAPDSCSYLHPVIPGEGSLLCINCYKNSARYLLFRMTGTMEPFQIWDREEAHDCRIDIRSADGTFQFALREALDCMDLTPPCADPSTALHLSEQDLVRFLPDLRCIPAPYHHAVRTAAYVQWSALVAPRDRLGRESMLMSKNWMTSVWSWDHCFNALALCRTDPCLAWDQFMLLFDHQQPSGCIPDFVNDAAYFFNCVKPPIHGWALKRMMEQMELSAQQLATAYDKLSAWTRWWFTQRDNDHDDLCAYWHGNDSGWDNSTAFDQSPCVISPDLNAFLVIQMDVLRHLAEQLGLSSESAQWAQQMQRTLTAMVRELFPEELPVVRDAETYRIIPHDSLLPYMSLLAGEYLPASCRDRMVAVLQGPAFWTPYGYATEKPASPAFEENGYWRGAVWAPVMYLLYDALSQAGALSAAQKTAEAYCRAVLRGGPAENHSALTGEGLRDPAYTWSSSVFLMFVRKLFPESPAVS